MLGTHAGRKGRQKIGSGGSLDFFIEYGTVERLEKRSKSCTPALMVLQATRAFLLRTRCSLLPQVDKTKISGQHLAPVIDMRCELNEQKGNVEMTTPGILKEMNTQSDANAERSFVYD